MTSKKYVVPDCKNCKSNEFAIYIDQYDAYHCTKCKVWISKQCGDPNCWYCVKRPKNPPEKQDV